MWNIRELLNASVLEYYLNSPRYKSIFQFRPRYSHDQRFATRTGILRATNSLLVRIPRSFASSITEDPRLDSPPEFNPVRTSVVLVLHLVEETPQGVKGKKGRKAQESWTSS